MATTNKVDTYELVTNRILEQMEKGIVPWQKPWGGASGAISYVTRKPYSLLNQFLLGKEGEYLTFNQVSNLGGKVKKGAKGSFVVFFKQYPIKEEVIDDNGEKKIETHIIPILKHYYVFHIDDCEGIESKCVKGDDTLEVKEDAEGIINNYFNRESCTIEIKQSDGAFYSPSEDKVVCPSIKQFDEVEEYYSTIFHETTHSTGHTSRLDRKLNEGLFGNDPYAKEELVAEIGSAFLCSKCGLDSKKAFKNSVAYIQNWAKQLKSDKKLIVSAAGKAQKAVNFILGIE